MEPESVTKTSKINMPKNMLFINIQAYPVGEIIYHNIDI